MVSPIFSDAAEELRSLIGDRQLGVYVQTFGCQQNEADSEKMLGIAISLGYHPVASPEQADLILVNTCAIREHAEKRALSIIGGYKHCKERDPSLIIGVCGCMPAQPHRAEEIKHHLPYVSFTLAPGQPELLPQLILSAMKHKKRRFIFDSECPSICEDLPVARREQHRAWVSVMYGCNNFCSYCIVPHVRGRERSRASEAIIREVSSLVEEGVKEITLLGQNVNSYRSDCDFSTLLERLASIPGEFLLRFMTSHPKDVPDRLIATMAAHPTKIAPHFHLPLQSGSDRILTLMNRRYTTDRYLSIVDKLRAAIPHVALSTDIIVGFPGETDEDFAGTLRILEQVQFDLVYSFIYSPRKGTAAAELSERVPSEVCRVRMEALLSAQAEHARARALPYQDTDVRVLVDGPAKNGEGILSGRTAHNKLVHFPGDVSLIGDYVWVHIDRADPFALHGTLIETKK